MTSMTPMIDTDFDPECLLLKKLILKKVSRRQQKHVIYPAIKNKQYVWVTVFHKSVEATVVPAKIDSDLIGASVSGSFGHFYAEKTQQDVQN